jgi:hypothetical protein
MGYRAHHNIKMAQKINLLTDEINMQIHNLDNTHENCNIDSVEYGIIMNYTQTKDLCVSRT